ncbi:MAG: hypothetical protein E6468_05400 [Varibaculum cambriense]|uniref:hypothetical protein n=1 Tax=Varibaculum cambriense TaxID=184870 RepID=UPI002910B77B|nr:hypothetical protein [Varibaculum cambriense]MDU6681272.1 hypothetical protein [Varibaculum cambriense]
MRVLKKTGLLAILLLTALFASFAVTGDVAYAEEPPKISDHVYDPANKLGGQADKVKERLTSLDRSGLHVYVAFPSEYSNDTVSNWNLMALQKSGAPQGSYMLSIVADNPNQTMYLASADNAAKLSQEELSAIASEKMVPLLNQQKYPEAVLAYLDALSVKAPEMGSGLAVSPWAMIAFLIALIVVIIVISRVIRARRKAQNRAEEQAPGKQGEGLSPEEAASQLPTSTLATRQVGGADSAGSASKESSKAAAVNADEDEQPSKGKFRLRLGRKKDKAPAKSKSPKTLGDKVNKPDFAAVTPENFATAASPAVPAAPTPQAPKAATDVVNKEANLAPTATGTAQTEAAKAEPAIPTALPGSLDTQTTGGKVPSLAELDQIALARTSSHAPATTADNAANQIPAAPQANAPYTPTATNSPLTSATASPAAPQRHSSVLRPGETTYLPPQANDDDTQVTSASQIRDYGQERRDEIARAKARAQAADRFREEQAQKPALSTPSTANTAQPQISPLPASVNAPQPPSQPFASPLPLHTVTSPAAPAAHPNATLEKPETTRPALPQQPVTNAAYTPAVTSSADHEAAPQVPDNSSYHAEQRGTGAVPRLPQMAPAVDKLTARSLPPISPQAIPQVSGQVSAAGNRPAPSSSTGQVPGSRSSSLQPAPAPEKPQAPAALAATSPASSQPSSRESAASQMPAHPVPARQQPAAHPQPDFTKVLRQADSWARKGASKLSLAQQRVGKTVTQPFALALVRAQDSVRAAFAEFATAQLQSRPIDQQIVAENLPGSLRELRDQITHFTNLYHQQTPLNEILGRFEREIVDCREELVRCRLIVERIQNVDPQKAARIGEDVMGAHKLLSRAQNLIEDAKTMDHAGEENEVLKATVRTENLLLQAQKIARQAHAEEAALRAAAKVETALTFAEKVEPLSEQVAILMAAVDDYIGVHTAKVGVAARTMLDLANRTLTRLDQPGSHDPQEALRLLQRAQQQTEQALRLAENDVAKRS